MFESGHNYSDSDELDLNDNPLEIKLPSSKFLST